MKGWRFSIEQRDGRRMLTRLVDRLINAFGSPNNSIDRANCARSRRRMGAVLVSGCVIRRAIIITEAAASEFA